MRSLIAFVLLIVLSAALVGQDTKPPDPKLKGQLPANWKKLGLAEAQVQAVYKVQAEYDAKTAALQAQILKLKAEEKADLMKVLTEAQKARLKELNEGK